MKTTQLLCAAILLAAFFVGCGPSTPPAPKTVKVKVDSTMNLVCTWDTVHYTDEFGDRTGSTGLYTTYRGEFSNSATAGSRLCGTVQTGSDGGFFATYKEYCDKPTKLNYDPKWGKVKVKFGEEPAEDYDAQCSGTGYLYFGKKLNKRMREWQGGDIQFALYAVWFNKYDKQSAYKWSIPACKTDTTWTYIYEDRPA